MKDLSAVLQAAWNKGIAVSEEDGLLLLGMGAAWQRQRDAEICETVDVASNGFSPQQVKLDCAHSIRSQSFDDPKEKP